jgi:hypothetical protein
MMQDYPKQITDTVTPKTETEKKESTRYGMPFLVSLVGYPLVYAFYGKAALEVSYLQNWLNTFFLVLSFNIVDLLFVDWLIFCTWTPSFLVLPGTEGNPGYKDYTFHFVAFLKGSIFSIVVALIVAAVAEGVFYLL